MVIFLVFLHRPPSRLINMLQIQWSPEGYIYISVVSAAFFAVIFTIVVKLCLFFIIQVMCINYENRGKKTETKKPQK